MILTKIIPKALGVWSLAWFILQLSFNPHFEPVLLIKLAEILLATYGIIFIVLDIKKDIENANN